MWKKFLKMIRYLSWASDTVTSVRLRKNFVVKIWFLMKRNYLDVEVYNYFRAVSTSGEFSERALSLCSHALRLNANNYNVWSYRKKILRNISYDPRKELCWIEELIRENPKNLYAWEHRRSIANLNLNYCDADTELELTENVLELDPKSYHAWQHRQWTIQTHKFSNFGLMTSEMKFANRMIQEDVRNNSAWNQRFFIIKQRGKIDFIFVKNEFSYVISKLKIAIDNESTWNYLRGLLNLFKDLKKLPHYQEFIDFVDNEFYEKKNINRHLIAFIIDTKIEMILEFHESNEMVQTEKVLQLCNLMAEKFDPLRKNYWKFVYKNFYFEKIKKRHASSDSGGTKSDETWKNKIGKKIAADEDLIEKNELNTKTSTKTKSKEKDQVRKTKNCEKPIGFGTDLLFEIMNKYNH